MPSKKPPTTPHPSGDRATFLRRLRTPSQRTLGQAAAPSPPSLEEPDTIAKRVAARYRGEAWNVWEKALHRSRGASVTKRQSATSSTDWQLRSRSAKAYKDTVKKAARGLGSRVGFGTHSPSRGSNAGLVSASVDAVTIFTSRHCAASVSASERGTDASSAVSAVAPTTPSKNEDSPSAVPEPSESLSASAIGQTAVDTASPVGLGAQPDTPKQLLFSRKWVEAYRRKKVAERRACIDGIDSSVRSTASCLACETPSLQLAIDEPSAQILEEEAAEFAKQQAAQQLAIDEPSAQLLEEEAAEFARQQAAQCAASTSTFLPVQETSHTTEKPRPVGDTQAIEVKLHAQQSGPGYSVDPWATIAPSDPISRGHSATSDGEIASV